jgi:hypothetical protein
MSVKTDRSPLYRDQGKQQVLPVYRQYDAPSVTNTNTLEAPQRVLGLYYMYSEEAKSPLE